MHEIRILITANKITPQTTNEEMTPLLYIVGLAPKGGAANQAYSWVLYYDMEVQRRYELDAKNVVAYFMKMAMTGGLLIMDLPNPIGRRRNQA